MRRRLKVSAVIVLTTIAFIGRTAGDEPDPSRIEFTYCVVGQESLLGMAPVIRILAENPGESDVYIHHTVTNDAKSLEFGSSEPSNDMWARPRIRRIGPGETIVVTERLSVVPGTPVGTYGWQVEVCILTEGFRYPEAPDIREFQADPCAFWEGERRVFDGEYSLVDPVGFDKIYFEKNLADWYWSGDQEMLKNSQEQHVEERPFSNQDIAELSSRPFKELRAQPWFDTEMNNQYFAAQYARSFGVSDVSGTLDYLSSLFRFPSQQVERDISPKAIHAAELLRFWSKESDQVWPQYVVALVGSTAGTKREPEALQELRGIADSCPDCFARWMAARLVESVPQ